MSAYQRIPVSRAEWRVIAGASLSNLVTNLPITLLGILAVFIRKDFDLTDQQVGIAVSIAFAAAGATSVSGGSLTERLGAVRAIRAAVGASSALAVAVMVFVDSWSALLIVLIGAGVTNSVSHPASNFAIVGSIEPQHRGLAFGIRQASGPVGSLIGGLAVPIIALSFGWRSTFTIIVVLAMWTWWLMSHRAPRVKGQYSGVSGRPRVARRVLVLLSVAFGLATIATTSLTAFYVLSIINRGYSAFTAGLWLAGGSILAVAARIYWGLRSDRRGGGNLAAVIALLLSGAVGLVLLSNAQSIPMLGIATIIAFSAGAGYSGLLHNAITLIDPRSPAKATGIVLVGAFVGGVFGPASFGTIVDHFDYGAAWVVMAVVLAGAAVLIGIARRAVLA